MKSNYKRIGDYIQLVDERNKDLKVTTLLGLSISKRFIPSVANTIGTNMARYKIIRKNQFACSLMQVRRDKKMPVALLQDFEEAIISQAYPVFEVKDPNELLPEYLMMWMSRSEFDRHACFLAVGGVRGSLEWDDFCNMTLPIPHPNQQKAIVKEYQTITRRIELNNQLNQKLEATAQALYRHWFVDFEFPDEKRLPYKSNGGEMVYCEDLDGEIPKGWDGDSYTSVVNLKGGGTPSTKIDSYWNGEIPFFTAKDVNKTYYSFSTEKSITTEGLNKCSSKFYPKNTTFIVARGATVGAVSIAGQSMAMNQSCYAILPKNDGNFFTHQLTLYTIKKLKREAIGATFNALVTKDFNEQIVIKPLKETVEEFEQKLNCVYELLLNTIHQNKALSELKELRLAEISKLIF